MVEEDKTPMPLDPIENKIGLPDEGLAASVPLLDVLPSRRQSIYEGTGIIRTPDRAILQVTKRCRMVRKACYGQLITKLLKMGLVELVREEPKETNGVFGIPKEEGTKQRLILEARRANLHFVEPDDPMLPNPGRIMQLEMDTNKDEIYIGKLDIDNFYHRLEMTEHLRTYFSLPRLIRTAKRSGPASSLSQWDGRTL